MSDDEVIGSIMLAVIGPAKASQREQELRATLSRALNTWTDPPGWVVKLHDRLGRARAD